MNGITYEEFSVAVTLYCKDMGVRPTTLFTLVHPHEIRGMQAHQAWKHDRVICQRVLNYLREHNYVREHHDSGGDCGGALQ